MARQARFGKLGVDADNGFTPLYITLEGKEEVVKRLKAKQVPRRALLPPWRQPRGKWMVSLVNFHTNATSKRWHLREIDSKFALNSTLGWGGRCRANMAHIRQSRPGIRVQSPCNLPSRSLFARKWCFKVRVEKLPEKPCLNLSKVAKTNPSLEGKGRGARKNRLIFWCLGVSVQGLVFGVRGQQCLTFRGQHGSA